jgi:predicted ATPase/DNA-binding CsgD family transcriptional regulator
MHILWKVFGTHMAFTNESPEHVSRLPIHRPPLVGRERELTTLSRLLTQPEVPLVTLTGPGGVGKSRLALEAARNARKAFGESITFVPLGAVHEPELVLPAVARAIGLVCSGDDALAMVRRWVSDRDYLLVIDNFEQVIDAANDLNELLITCPHLKMLMTSRAPLRIAAEQEFPVRPLSVAGTATREVRVESPATMLFVQRARAVNPEFSVDGDTLDDITELCTRLDGLPLAIELAAARSKLLTPRMMVSKLNDRFQLLRGGARDVPPRMQSMRDTIEWSYDLLDAGERWLFRQLSVFPGGFTLDAAQSICDATDRLDRSTEWLVVDGLASLLDKSLVVQLGHLASERRFGMLETIRAYAFDQLIVCGESNSAHAALTAWIRQLIVPAHTESFGPRQPEWTLLLEVEHTNLCASLAWSIDQGNTEVASALIYSALGSWHTSGRFSEGRAWAERGLAISDASDPYAMGALLLAAGWLSIYEGNFGPAVDYLTRARPLALTAGDRMLLAQVIHAHAAALGAASQFDAAITAFEEALQHYRTVDSTVWLPHARNGLGHAVFESGLVDEAEEYFNAALAEFRRLGNSYGEATVLMNLAKVARARSDYDRSMELLGQALVLRWAHGDRPGVVGCLRGLGITLALTGNAATAMRLFGACEKLRLSIGLPPAMAQSSYWSAVARVRDRLGTVKSHQCWTAGQSAEIEQIVQEATGKIPQSPEIPPAQNGARPSDLTPREIEVLRLLREGCSNRAIADRLFISDRTAQTHVQHILDKLGVATRGAAAVAAIELQIV